MRILIFRHGDPDYEADNLTEKGRREAQLLAGSIDSFGIDEVYVSPLGRAAATADFNLEKLGLQATTLDWLKEFPAYFDPNKVDASTRAAYINELKKDDASGLYEKRIVWDMMPSYFSKHPELFDVNEWRNSDLVRSSDAVQVYDHIIGAFDEFLSVHGYERSGSIYSVRQGNSRTIAFFCHFGVTCVLLSRLWNTSPFVPLQQLAMAPTSLTELVTEEREKGIAIFRTLRIGDITHLTVGGEKPSFSARFCEQYENEYERH